MPIKDELMDQFLDCISFAEIRILQEPFMLMWLKTIA